MHILNDSSTRLRENIDNLRQDMYSNSNFILQSLLLFLSLILIVSSSIILLTDKFIDAVDHAISDPLPAIVSWIIVPSLILLIIFVLFANIYTRTPAKLLKNKIKKSIKAWTNNEKQHEITLDTVEKEFNKYVNNSNKMHLKIIYSLEFCIILILCVALKKINEEKGMNLLFEIDKVFLDTEDRER